MTEETSRRGLSRTLLLGAAAVTIALLSLYAGPSAGASKFRRLRIVI